jgi:hypothetical protein
MPEITGKKVIINLSPDYVLSPDYGPGLFLEFFNTG